MDEYEDGARRIVEVLGDAASREFVTPLESDDTIRADDFGDSTSEATTTRCSTRSTIWRSIRLCVGG